jgi:tetratricopeptide (TPR) repeat protein
MTIRSAHKKIVLFAIVFASALIAAPRSFAQMQSSPAPQQAPADKSAPGTPPAATPAAPIVDPAEEADYKTFYELKPEETDKRIDLGDNFTLKYPTSKYAESVYTAVALAEYNKQDFPKMYAEAGKALAINPDDVQILVIVGWVIPHSYNPNDANAAAQLDKAEKYEKHALELVPTLPKPATLTDDQFAKAKLAYESQAHSALGLVYFRRDNYDGAVTELTKAVATTTPPDPTDYYVLGLSLFRLDRFADSADAYSKCAALPGGLQGRCKQQADEAKKQAASKPAAPKP